MVPTVGFEPKRRGPEAQALPTELMRLEYSVTDKTGFRSRVDRKCVVLSAWVAATLAALANSTWSLSLALTSLRVRVYSTLETAFHFCAGAAVPDLTAADAAERFRLSFSRV